MWRELLVYVHPVMATVSLLLAVLVYRDGFAQRKQRLRRIPSPPHARARHVRLGPWAAVLMFTSAVVGLASAVLLRAWVPLATFHGRLGVATTLLFLVMGWLGRRLVANDRHLAGRHGVLGFFALLSGAVTGVLGISLLP